MIIVNIIEPLKFLLCNSLNESPMKLHVKRMLCFAFLEQYNNFISVYIYVFHGIMLYFMMLVLMLQII
jgi:hypothetical protein